MTYGVSEITILEIRALGLINHVTLVVVDLIFIDGNNYKAPLIVEPKKTENKLSAYINRI